MEEIHSSELYNNSDDLWVITCYFNPNNYRSKLANYRIFADRILKSGINLLTVECAFGDTPFVLGPFPNVLQIRSQHIMWQKERLLNIALSHLPKEVEKVAWLDCDILFSNADWAVQASKLLDSVPVVQLFENAVRLPKGQYVKFCVNSRSRVGSVLVLHFDSLELQAANHGIEH